MNAQNSQIDIRSSQYHYSVEFFPALESLLTSLAQVPRPVIIIDGNIARLFKSAFSIHFAVLPTLIVEVSEGQKTFQGCSQVLDFLIHCRATRKTTLIAIGGGILQDIATFCAHIYFRGIKWIFVPTTLLAMSDSCIGAKASINHSGFKNQLGVFHAPSKVLIWIGFTSTLSALDMASGFGEVVKIHLAGDSNDFDELMKTVGSDGLSTPNLPCIIDRCLRIKKIYIEADEFDDGIRRHLNYGHTFGHALEAVTENAIPHGIAVAIGMDVVNYIAVKRGELAKSDYDHIHLVLKRFFTFDLPRPITAREWLIPTDRDKKATEGAMKLVLLQKPGKLTIVEQRDMGSLRQWLEEYLEVDNLFS